VRAVRTRITAKVGKCANLRLAFVGCGHIALDRGPFGHTDLFGSDWEWTRTFGGFPDNGQFCNLADGSPDFVTFGPTPNMQSDVVAGAAESGYCAAFQSSLDPMGVATCVPDPCGPSGHCSAIHSAVGTVIECLWPL